jgi:hypothetical protein
VAGVPDVIDGQNLDSAQIGARRLMKGWRRNARRAALLTPSPASNGAERGRRRKAAFAQ